MKKRTWKYPSNSLRNLDPSSIFWLSERWSEIGYGEEILTDIRIPWSPKITSTKTYVKQRTLVISLLRAYNCLREKSSTWTSLLKRTIFWNIHVVLKNVLRWFPGSIAKVWNQQNIWVKIISWWFLTCLLLIFYAGKWKRHRILQTIARFENPGRVQSVSV